jgi:hypothetical protein
MAQQTDHIGDTNKMVTAVEWLMYRIKNQHLYDFVSLNELEEQAKAMEKEQKKFMFDCGRQYQLTGEGTFTQIYNETYGKE